LWDCPSEDCVSVNPSEAEVCQKCETEKPTIGAKFKCSFCKYTTWDEVELVKDEDGDVKIKESCPNCNKVFLLKGPMSGIFKKLYDRFAITFDFESVKGTAIAYQTEQCHSAMKVGGLFGDMNAIVDIPVYTIDTDSVIATLSNRVGVLFVLIILLAFCMIFVSIYNAFSPLRVMALCTLVFQGIITYLGTMNMIPATGIGVPLISRGGSNLDICYLLMYLILSSAKFAQGGKKSEKE